MLFKSPVSFSLFPFLTPFVLCTPVIFFFFALIPAIAWFLFFSSFYPFVLEIQFYCLEVKATTCWSEAWQAPMPGVLGEQPGVQRGPCRAGPLACGSIPVEHQGDRTRRFLHLWGGSAGSLLCTAVGGRRECAGWGGGGDGCEHEHYSVLHPAKS